SFDDIRTGKLQPKDAAEAIRFAKQSTKNRHYALATKHYRDAFAKDAKLGDNLDLGHRYNAACFAVLAPEAKGDEVEKMVAERRPQLRQDALKWLQADLAAWTKRVVDGSDADRKAAARKLQAWLRDTDLTWVRDGDLANLSAVERRDWQQLWTDVAA